MTKSTMINLPFHESLSRIKSQIEEISEFNSTPEEGITRIVYTEEDLNAKTFIKNYMMEVGLEVSEDAIGNIFGRLEGTDPGLPSICSGSHLDAPLNSGMFDGIVGVVGAIEALRIIKESELMHKHSLEVIVFASEEPTRFGVGCLGSRALTGQLSPSDLKKW